MSEMVVFATMTGKHGLFMRFDFLNPMISPIPLSDFESADNLDSGYHWDNISLPNLGGCIQCSGLPSRRNPYPESIPRIEIPTFRSEGHVIMRSKASKNLKKSCIFTAN